MSVTVLDIAILRGARVSEDGTRERALGTLLGQAAGDALGTTVEFLDAAAIRRQYPDGLRKVVGGGPFRVKAGQVTDDTELALALARSLVNKGTYDAEDAAGRYVDWYRSEPFDIGETTRRAFGRSIDSAKSRAAQLETAADPDSQANGSLMRMSPLGVLGWDVEPHLLALFAARDSRLSHPHAICQAACVVFTHAIAFAIQTGADATAVFDNATMFATNNPLGRPVLELLDAARVAAPTYFQANQGWVRIAFQNAFYQLLHAKTFEDGVVDTVMRGGDTDTNGCIVGALLGSVHGADAIPEQWRECVLSCKTSRPTEYGCTDLPQLAEKLCFPTR